MKLKSFLTALTVAVGLASAATAAGTADENGIVPQMWFKFDGNANNIGSNGATISPSGTYEAIEEGSDDKALVMSGAVQSGGGAPTAYPLTVHMRAQLVNATTKLVWSFGGKNVGGINFVIAGEDKVKIMNHSYGNLSGNLVGETTVAGATSGYHYFTYVAQSGSSKLYYDGVLVASSTSANTAGNGIWGLGKVANGTTYFVEGIKIADLRTYNVALTDAQIANIVGVSGKTYKATISGETTWDEIVWSPTLEGEPEALDELELTGEGTSSELTFGSAVSYGCKLTLKGDAIKIKAADSFYEDGCWIKQFAKFGTLTCETEPIFADVLDGYHAAYAKTSSGFTLRGQNMDVISINFANGQSVSGTDYTGLAPVQGDTWMNMATTWGSGGKTVDLGTIKATDDGETTEDVTDATGSCYAANTYGWNSATDVFLKGYLDDGGNHAQVTVTGIPYSKYDVIVYCATDNESKSFRAVTVNDTAYTYDSDNPDAAKSGSDNWGASHALTAVYGTNAIRVRNQTASTLTIVGGSNGDGARGCIAAIQIVCTGTYVPPAPEEKMATTFVTEGAPTEAYGANVKQDNTAYGQQTKYTTEGFGQVIAVTNATGTYTIFGGAAKSAGAITTSIWMEVLGGTFKSIFGGSNSDDWSSGDACSITGDIVLEVGGDTVTENVVGGNYKDGKGPTIDGNITVVVKDNAVVNGVIAGSGMSAHSGLTTVTGNTKVTVKNIQSDNSAGALISADSSDYIVGGGVYGTNIKSREVVNGNSEVVINIDEGEGDFVKNIVGGGLIPSGGANHDSSVTATVGGNSSVTITAPSTVMFTGNIIAGGSVTGGGDATVAGTATVTLSGGKYSGSIKGGVATGTKTLAIEDDIVIKANDNEVSGFDAFTVAAGKKVTIEATEDKVLTFAVAGSDTIEKTGSGTLTMQGFIEGAEFGFVAKEGAITASGATYSSSFSADEGASVSFVWDLSTGAEITSVPTLKSSSGALAFTVTLNKTDILGSRKIQLATLSEGMTADDVDVAIINADSGNAVPIIKELEGTALYATPDAAARDLVYKPTEATNLTWEAGTEFGDEQFRDYDNVSFQTADEAAVEVGVSVPANISAGNLEIGATYTFTGKPIIASDVKTLANADVTFENDLVADSVVVTDGSTFKAAEIVASEVAVTNATFEASVIGPSMKYVRLTITETQTSGNQPAVGEFRLYRGSATMGYTIVDWPVGTKISDCTGLVATKTTTDYPGEVGAGLGNVGGNECQPGDLIDGYYGNKSSPKIYGGASAYSSPAYNKWWPTSVSTGPWTVTIEFPYPVATFSGCNFCLADHGPRNPTAWTIEVSDDGQEWIEVNNTSNATWNAQYEWAGEGENVPAFLNKGTDPTTVAVGDGSTIVADGAWTAALEVGGAVTFKGVEGKYLTLDAASTSQFDDGAVLTFDLTDYGVSSAGKQYVIAGPTDGWPEVSAITIEPAGKFDLYKDEEGYYVLVKSGNYWIGDQADGVGTWDLSKTLAWGADATTSEKSVWLNGVAANFTRNGTVTIDTSAGEIAPTALNFGGEEGIAVAFTGDVEALAGVPLAIAVTNATITIDNAKDMTLGAIASAADATNTITKMGAGTLTLPNTFDFAGGVLNVNAGTVKLTANNSIQNAETVTVAGTLDLNGTSNHRGYVLAAGGTIVNNGNAVATGSMQMNALTLNGDATVGGTGDFGILGSGWGDTTLTLNGNALVKTGTNSFWLCNTAVDDGTIDLQEGVIDTNSGDTTIPGTLNLAAGTEFKAKGTPVIGTVTGSGTLSGAVTITNKIMGTVKATATITFADGAKLDATGCTFEEDQKILAWSVMPTNLVIVGYTGALTLEKRDDGLYAVDLTKRGDHIWTPTAETGTWSDKYFNGENSYRDPSASATFLDGEGVAATTITIDGTRTVTSFVIDNTNTEYVLEGGNFVSTTFEKKGTGTATLKVGADTRPGAATITAGTLVIGTDASNNSYKFQADSIVIKSGATLDIGSRDAIFNTKSITIEKDAKLTTKGFNNLFGVTISGGTIETVAGYTQGWKSWCLTDTLTVTGDVTSYITTGENPGSNYGLQLATGIFDVQGSSTLEVSTPMQDGPGDRGTLKNQVRKTGTGTMVVKTTPTYTGITDIQAGKYILDCGNVSGTYQVAENATFEMGTNRNLTVSGAGAVKVVLTDDDMAAGEPIVAFTVPSEATTPTITVLNEEAEDITKKVTITDGGTIQVSTEARIGDTHYGTLAEALEAAEEGDTVTLLKDVQAASVTVPQGVTLDLAEFKVQTQTIVNHGTITVYDMATATALANVEGTLLAGAELTDGETMTYPAGTTVTLTNLDPVYPPGHTNIPPRIDVVVPKDELLYTAEIGSCKRIYVEGYEGISFGSKINPGWDYHDQLKTIVSITGDVTIVSKVLIGDFAEMEVVGEVYTSDGTEEGAITLQGEHSKFINSGEFVENEDVVVSDELAAKGFAVVYEDGVYSVGFSGVAEARIGTTSYPTLAEALDAAQAGETVTLLKDITVESGYTALPEDVGIDLGGFTFTAPKGFDCYGTTSVSNGTLNVKKWAIWANDNATISLGAVAITTTSDELAAIAAIGTNLTVTIEEDATVEAVFRAIELQKDAVAIVKGKVTTSSTADNVSTVFLADDSLLEVYGTVKNLGGNSFAISSNGTDPGMPSVAVCTGGLVETANSIAIYVPNDMTVDVGNGGEVKGATAIYAKAGQILISHGAKVTATLSPKVPFVHSDDGANPTGDAIVFEATDYPYAKTPETWLCGSISKTATVTGGVGMYAQPGVSRVIDATDMGTSTIYTIMDSSGPTIDPVVGGETNAEITKVGDDYLVEPNGDATVKINDIGDANVIVTNDVNLVGVPAKQIVVKTAAGVTIPATALVGGDADGFNTALDKDGYAVIEGENIPVTPTVTTAETSEGTIADGAVATKAIPGLTYTLVRDSDVGGTFKTTADSETATTTTVTLKDETGTKPTDKAFYKIQVSK